MPLSVPPELKKIKVFIQRAEELDRAKSAESRVVAFYCRQWAVQQGIPLSTSSDVAKGCLGELLGQLEGEKQAMSVFSRVESRQICRNFAEQIFEKANAEDRSGGADKGTARTFYASASFFEILQQFNEDVGDAEGNAEEAKEDEQKRLYAKWKATEILKALREGRMPTPGAYGEELGGEEDKEDDEGGGAESETPSQEETPANIEPEPEPEPEPELPAPSEPALPSIGFAGAKQSAPPPYPGSNGTGEGGGDTFVKPTTPVAMDRPPIAPAFDDLPPSPTVLPPPVAPPAPAPVHPPESNKSGWGFGKKKKGQSGISKKAIEDATELTRFALAALEGKVHGKNVDLAADRLAQALSALGR